jgi:hypothetical protein
LKKHLPSAWLADIISFYKEGNGKHLLGILKKTALRKTENGFQICNAST